MDLMICQHCQHNPPDSFLAIQHWKSDRVILGLAIGFGWAIDTALPWGYTLVIGMCLLWGIFGVYRTIVQARAEPKDMDLV